MNFSRHYRGAFDPNIMTLGYKQQIEMPDIHARRWHAKASHRLEDGMNTVQILFLPGHEQLETTMIYQDVTTEDECQALVTLRCEKDAKSHRNGKSRWLFN